jgi:hypothetical protein
VMAETAEPIIDYRSAHILNGQVTLEGTLNLPREAVAVVLFVHGSGSGRHSPRNWHVANVLNRARLATLLIDLLTPSKKLTCSDRATNSSCWWCHKRGSGGERLEFDGISEVGQAFDQAVFCRSVERRLK